MFFKGHQGVFPERYIAQTTNKLYLRDAQTTKKINFCISSDGATFPQALPSLTRASGEPVPPRKMLKVPESGKTKQKQKNDKKQQKNNKKKKEGDQQS